MTQKNNILPGRQADILLLQHNNPYAVVLERQMFKEALDKEKLHFNSENCFTGIKTVISRRKVQRVIGFLTHSWILNGTVLEKYLDECKKNERKPIVLFLNSFFTEIRYPTGALKYLKEKYEASFILYYIDTIDRGVSQYANFLSENGVFDFVYTFDKHDAQKYGLSFWQTPYSKLKMELSSVKDLYFCGVDTDRIEIIHDFSRNSDINFEMDLIQINKDVEYSDSRICVHSVGEIMPYETVLKKTLQANCILEIVRPGQVGFTLRAYEAVVYNKKLLTNNECIKEFKFYNSEYMKIFKSVEKIDWKWVKEKNDVDYHYDGSFSPIKFIEEIEYKVCHQEISH